MTRYDKEYYCKWCKQYSSLCEQGLALLTRNIETVHYRGCIDCVYYESLERSKNYARLAKLAGN